MDNRDSDSDDHKPSKRPRHSPPPPPLASTSQNPNGNGRRHSSVLPPLSLSILGVEPLDEFIREVADFVHAMIVNRPPDATGVIEVEAKIGVLRDRMSGQRLQLPVLVETKKVKEIVMCALRELARWVGEVDEGPVRFESNMSAMQHKHFNTLLNTLKPSPTSSPSPIDYTHLRLIDSFYTEGGPGGGGRDANKVRVTRDERSGAVQACVRKVRLGNLDVYSPKRAADWRISVNVEVPVPQPTGTPSHTRRKDRMSYSHEEFVIDLTQVTSTGNSAKPEILHELEVEIARPEYLLAAALRRGDPNVSELERGAFDELIRAFVNNARILVRNAGDGWQ